MQDLNPALFFHLFHKAPKFSTFAILKFKKK